MSTFTIAGSTTLSGEIAVRGAKNAALKLIPAALLSNEPMTIRNLPDIEDVRYSLAIAADLGAKIERRGDKVTIDPSTVTNTTIKPEFANKLRASIMFVAPLLARFGEVHFPHPGGCVIGAGGRPIDLFLEGFARLGATVDREEQFYRLRAKDKRLIGAPYFFPKMAVTATESLLMAAVLATGRTVIKNAAMEPEIVQLARYLNEQGAAIEGAGTPTITVSGVERLTGGETAVIPDRIETGSFALMAAATKSELTITDCDPAHIEILLTIFERIGIPFEAGQNSLRIGKAKKIAAYDIKTHEYPGFPTDLQSPYTVLMTQAAGRSLIHETIYDRRLLYVDMLSQMGADITMCDPHRVVIHGPTPLQGRKLVSPDLRAGIALLIAALAAKGKTEIGNIYQIDRGYERIDERLRAIGADIKRLDATSGVTG